MDSGGDREPVEALENRCDMISFMDFHQILAALL